MIDVTCYRAVQVTVPQLEMGRDGRSVSSPKDDKGNERDGSARGGTGHGTALGRPSLGQELVLG